MLFTDQFVHDFRRSIFGPGQVRSGEADEVCKIEQEFSTFC